MDVPRRARRYEAMLCMIIMNMTMNIRMNSVRRANEENVNEAVPPQAPQNPQVPIEEGAMSNVEIGSAIHNLTQVWPLKFLGMLGCK
uniref:Uncharacterized protein n=1 Tax=Solanum tuberosum TaxID=4113 RepID=M1DTA6_SOLTU